METDDKDFEGIAKDNANADNIGNSSGNAAFKDFVANDGMTAASARNTKDDGNAQHDAGFDVNEKPGSKYNINDQAHSQSSKEDFVKTVSNFEHSDGTHPPAAIDSKNLSPD